VRRIAAEFSGFAACGARPHCAHRIPRISEVQKMQHKLGSISAAIASSLMLAALASADTAPTANKWRIELDGQALSSGDLQFRVTPRQGDSVDVVATIRSGRAENNVAKDVRDAFAAKLSPERYTVEVDDGEDILIKKKDGQPDFALELVDSNVRNVNIKVEGE
jgi:hypothetical protein